jgi:hypothetical protein
MTDQTKTISKQLYDALLAYLIQSSIAMDETSRALAPDPLHTSRVDVLNESLYSARVLLSKVINSCSNPFIIRFLLLFIAAKRLGEEILAGSTEETMRSLYFRKQRVSIYHAATIGDIPQEVLRKAFIYPTFFLAKGISWLRVRRIEPGDPLPKN